MAKVEKKTIANTNAKELANLVKAELVTIYETLEKINSLNAFENESTFVYFQTVNDKICDIIEYLEI